MLACREKLIPALALIMAARSSNQVLLGLSQRYIYASLEGIEPMLQERFDFLSKKLFIFSPPVTLKMRSRSPKSIPLLSLPKWYIYASLVKICPLFQKISYIQDYYLENEDKVTENLTCPKPVMLICPCRSDDFPSTDSRNISFLKKLNI